MFLIRKIKLKLASVYTKWLSSTVQPEEKEVKVVSERNNLTCSDFIDYDGMGNQGRFPSVRKRK